LDVEDGFLAHILECKREKQLQHDDLSKDKDKPHSCTPEYFKQMKTRKTYPSDDEDYSHICRQDQRGKK